MSSVTLSNLNAYFKQRFGNIQRILPEWAIMQDLIPFESRMQVGRSFQEPLGVTGELGFTLQGGSNLGSLQTLNDSVPFSWVESLIKPAEITGRSQISYYLLEAARSQGPAAYGRSLDELILSLDAGHRRYVETYMLYGQTSLGAVSAVTSISSTVKDATISLATWAPGLWVQLESCKVDIYQSDGTTLRNANGDVTLTQVQDPTGRKLRLTFASSTDAGNLAIGDLIVFKGSGAASAVSANQQFAGIDATIQNTGTLFGYDASTHNLLRGTVIDLGGVPLTMSGINTGVTAMVVRGGYGKISVVMSPYSWQDMAEDLTAQRRLGRDEKREYDVGPSRITFWGTNGAEIGLIPHPMVKTGDAFFLMPEHWLRSGASDIAYRAPGYGEDHYFLQLPTQNGVELRNYSAQFLLSRQPAKALKIKNIAPRSYPL